MQQLPWTRLAFTDVCRQLQTNHKTGLSPEDAGLRLKQNGRNILEKKKQVSPVLLFFSQFQDFMVLVLLAATLLSALLGEYSDAVVIICIVFLNALLGFLQEYRAEKSLEALRELTAPTAKVYRGGKRYEIPAEEIVPGDVVLIEAGDRIPADIRLGEVHGLLVNEAALTGESVPVTKTSEALWEESPALGDCVNMVFMGTMSVGGYGSGVVVATGMKTEMGRIAYLIQDAEEEETPLQKRLGQLGRLLVAGCLSVCGLVVLLGLLQGLELYKMFLAGISLAVAAIPEGLPAVVTIALALGVQRMVKKNAIVRRLPAVETLGCATVICSDKTGTLTQNKMNVKEIWAGGRHYTVEGEGYAPHGAFKQGDKKVKPQDEPALLLALTAAVLCNNASLYRGSMPVMPLWRQKKVTWEIQGDPTEGALLAAGAKAGLWREDLEQKLRRVAEQPFDGTRKKMSVLYEGENGRILYVKGAPEIVLGSCTQIYYEGRVVELSRIQREEVLQQTEKMAALALRTLAVAYKPQTGGSGQIREENLIFLGLLGMMDPPRPEVLPAIRKCHKAGIKTVMITGDHKTTAIAVARSLHLLPRHGKVLTGRELDAMTDGELEQAVEHTYVYARVTPEHKLRIVRALKRRDHIVAMTGDGVNDAPAVKEADIGIAMGESGTDVTREAAAMVLADDNFATIVNAVEEGRGIYDNIRKFIRFLLACNTGEILTMLLAMLAGLPLPLRPIQILWINLVTDGLPAMALGVDPPDSRVMERKPRHPAESIFARGLWEKILGRGIAIGLTTVLIFAFALGRGAELDTARTMAFVTLIIAQMVYVFDCRSEQLTVWQISIFTNIWLLAAVGSSLLLLALVLYHPGLASVFMTTPLSAKQWLLIVGAAAAPDILGGLLALLKAVFLPRVAVLKK
ncbi:MAG: calcium-translocating P-type ATPase, SERCA-type [Firmicutes bacterium]|jgi:Ca2+-transporting ATPase|nr:calcium-translocating P-type ATPase, SERCA-type [Bacillota bacterium]